MFGKIKIGRSRRNTFWISLNFGDIFVKIWFDQFTSSMTNTNLTVAVLISTADSFDRKKSKLYSNFWTNYYNKLRPRN